MNTDKLLEALEKIANPIKYLREDAEKQGAVLNGVAAIALAKDGDWLSEIAKKAIAEWQSNQPTVEPYQEIIDILEENYEASKNLTDEDKARSAQETVNETYEDLLYIFRDRQHRKLFSKEQPTVTSDKYANMGGNNEARDLMNERLKVEPTVTEGPLQL